MKKHLLLLLLAFALCSFSCKDKDHASGPEIPNVGVLQYQDGISRISADSLAFVLFAPNKETVHLVGDFNDWKVEDAYKMQKIGDRFLIKIGNLEADKEYICQYLIDNTIRIADPYTNKTSDPNDKYIPAAIYPNLIAYPAGKTKEIAMVVSTRQDNYNWKIKNYTVENRAKLVIYEILIRDFTAQRSIKAVQEKLTYLKALGINAIELMPFNEFEGNESWGYNPSFYFAPDKAYGTADDYKAFIDECHANGMAVIMDMVLNHSYGQSPLVRMYQNAGGVPTAENPWYNVKSPNTEYAWGCDFNHESEHTQAFVDRVCAYWIKEYKIDGYRFDFTKGFTNKSGNGWAYDASRIAILKRIADKIWEQKSDALVILEHLTDNSEEKVLAEHGIMLWGNLNYNMNEVTMGYGENKENGKNKGDISWASYKERGWTAPNLVAYMESHDEERLMFKNTAYGKTTTNYDVTKLSTGLERTAAAAVIFFSIPGSKMIWQFGELGYDFELNNDRLAKKPIRWNYYDEPDRKALYDVFAEMINLRKNNPVFSTSDYRIDLANNFKYIVLNAGGKTAVAMANFDVAPAIKSVNFGKAGNWQEHFSQSTFTTSAATESVTLGAGEYRLYLED